MRTMLAIGTPGHPMPGAFATFGGTTITPEKRFDVGDVCPPSAIQARPKTVDLNINTGFSPSFSERSP